MRYELSFCYVALECSTGKVCGVVRGSRMVIDSDKLWRDYEWAADCVEYMVERLWKLDNATRRDERVG